MRTKFRFWFFKCTNSVLSGFGLLYFPFVYEMACDHLFLLSRILKRTVLVDTIWQNNSNDNLFLIKDNIVVHLERFHFFFSIKNNMFYIYFCDNVILGHKVLSFVTTLSLNLLTSISFFFPCGCLSFMVFLGHWAELEHDTL